MRDRACDLAQALVEAPETFTVRRDSRGQRIDGERFRRFLAERFPDITEPEVRRGISIAVEAVLISEGLHR